MPEEGVVPEDGAAAAAGEAAAKAEEGASAGALPFAARDFDPRGADQPVRTL